MGREDTEKPDFVEKAVASILFVSILYTSYFREFNYVGVVIIIIIIVIIHLATKRSYANEIMGRKNWCEQDDTQWVSELYICWKTELTIWHNHDA